MTDAAPLRPLDPSRNAHIAACRASFGAACAALIARGGVSEVQIVQTLDDESAMTGLDTFVRIVAAQGLCVWRVTGGHHGIDAEVEECNGSDGAEAMDALFASTEAFIDDLGRLEVPWSSDGGVSRRWEVVVTAGAVDDAIAWNVSGGPYYTTIGSERVTEPSDTTPSGRPVDAAQPTPDPRPAGDASQLDLDVIDARWSDATKGPWRAMQIKGFGAVVLIVSKHPEARWYQVVAQIHNVGGRTAAEAVAAAREDVPNLVARVRHLESESHRLAVELDATEKAYNDLMAQVWRAMGEEHKPPADVRVLLARVEGLRVSHRERSEAVHAMARRALAAERLLDATEGTEREEELARQIRAEADERVAAARHEFIDGARETAEREDAIAGEKGPTTL